MAVRMRDHASAVVPELSLEPTPFRVRAYAFDRVFLDTADALLVWEPGRVVPMYAVPLEDLDAELLTPTTPDDTPVQLPPVLGPENFRWHTCAGTAHTLRVHGGSFDRAAFRPEDPDLVRHVVLEFTPFTWLEEDDPVTGHPHDPFKRIDVRASSRHVVVALDGVLLADSRRPRILAETLVPLRWYLPRDDVRMELLARSASRTTCAYKGHATYFSYEGGGRVGRDLAWTYEQPLPEAEAVRGHVCFYDERVDVTVDGVLLERPRTPWSLDERAT